ncbi:MAG: LacI family DNA-binding transcriptional regulator [Aristaeellaceae bacterium]
MGALQIFWCAYRIGQRGKKAMKKVTIQSISEMASVSKSTVSRALNDTGYVQEDIKARILQVADELGYTRRQKPANADPKRRITIAVVFPSFSDTFFGSIIEGISSVADREDSSILLFSTHDSVEREQRILKKLREMNISGMIFTPVAAYDGIEGWNRLQREMSRLQVPIVLVDRSDKRSNCDSIVFDNYNGAYLLGERLAKEGYSDIGAIVGDTCLQLGHDRLAGFSQALSVNGLTVSTEFFYTDERIISTQMAYEYTMERIRLGKLPKAVFLSNSLVANGFLKALFANDMKPGQDVRCMGFDYLDIQNVIDLQYTYLERETFKTGQMAVQMILDHFKTEIVSRREFITPARMIN